MNALVLKTSMSVRASQVRILSPPPFFLCRGPNRVAHKRSRWPISRTPLHLGTRVPTHGDESGHAGNCQSIAPHPTRRRKRIVELIWGARIGRSYPEPEIKDYAAASRDIGYFPNGDAITHGISMVKVEPVPGALTTSTEPPCASAMALTMANPTPSPPTVRVGSFCAR